MVSDSVHVCWGALFGGISPLMRRGREQEGIGGRMGKGAGAHLGTLTRVLRWAWESLVATKYWTGASRMMTAAPIKALTPRM